MLLTYSPPTLDSKAFSCPTCGVYAKQDWGLLYRNRLDINNGRLVINTDSKMNSFRATLCENCSGNTIWYQERMIFPFKGTAALPNADMPENVRQDYMEAREIMFLSPKGAAALLRLALKKLFIYLGGKGQQIEEDVHLLIQNGLPPKLVQALHALKVYGHQAIQPGQISDTDDVETVHKLLAFINIICDNQITQPRLIELYAGKTEF